MKSRAWPGQREKEILMMVQIRRGKNGGHRWVYLQNCSCIFNVCVYDSYQHSGNTKHVIFAPDHTALCPGINLCWPISFTNVCAHRLSITCRDLGLYWMWAWKWICGGLCGWCKGTFSRPNDNFVAQVIFINYVQGYMGDHFNCKGIFLHVNMQPADV